MIKKISLHKFFHDVDFIKSKFISYLFCTLQLKCLKKKNCMYSELTKGTIRVNDLFNNITKNVFEQYLYIF